MGFLKSIISEKSKLLVQKNHHAFVLLWVIAHRARRTDNEITGLKMCEAMIGDYREYSMTRSEYRTAIKILTDSHLIAIKMTNRGTIATVLNTDIFDINANGDSQQDSQDIAIKSPPASPSNRHKQEVKKEEEGKECKEKDKRLFGEHVLLTEDEYGKLKEFFGQDDLNNRIEEMNLYIEKIGKTAFNRKYKSHYATLLSWYRLECERRGIKPRKIGDMKAKPLERKIIGWDDTVILPDGSFEPIYEGDPRAESA